MKVLLIIFKSLAFINNLIKDSNAQNSDNQKADSAPTNSQAKVSKEIKAAVVYATYSGNSELVAQAVWDGLNSTGIKAEILKAEKTNPEEVTKNADLIVLVSSTYDVGKLNFNMTKFNDELLKMQLPDKDIEVIGLGDSANYDIFCGAADILEETVKKVGAKKIMDTIRLDGPPHKRLQYIKDWAIELAGKL